MNILMLGRWLPPPRRPVRATREYHFARQLATKHQITLAFVTDNPDTVGSISALRAEFGDLEFAAVPRSWKSLAGAVSLATGESCTLSYFRSEALRTRLADRLRRTRYDLVFVSTSGMIQYALDTDTSTPLLVDYGGVDSEWWGRHAARVPFPATRFFRTEAMRLRIAEAAAARRAAWCLVESEEAAAIVRSLDPAGPVAVMSNGVDTEFFARSARPRKGPTVVINAALGSEAQARELVGFCGRVLALVRASVPEARMSIASRDTVRVSGAIAGRSGVEIVGPSTDVRPLLHEGAVGAAPAEAGGDVRASVLELMAAGIPVVANVAAVRQLKAVAGRDIQIADQPDEFARELVHLLRDSSARAAMGDRGRAYVGTHHAWGVVTARLVDIVEKVTGAVPSTKVVPGGTRMPAAHP